MHTADVVDARNKATCMYLIGCMAVHMLLASYSPDATGGQAVRGPLCVKLAGPLLIMCSSTAEWAFHMSTYHF
jgi:hypothetical protein